MKAPTNPNKTECDWDCTPLWKNSRHNDQDNEGDDNQWRRRKLWRAATRISHSVGAGLKCKFPNLLFTPFFFTKDFSSNLLFKGFWISRDTKLRNRIWKHWWVCVPETEEFSAAAAAQNPKRWQMLKMVFQLITESQRRRAGTAAVKQRSSKP